MTADPATPAPASIGAPRTARVTVRALGGFEVSVDERALTRADWQRLSAERLFKLLLVTPGHVVSREVAAEMLWPDAEPDMSRTNLRKAIHFAHRALAPVDALGGDAGWLRLQREAIDLDVDRLREALEALGALEGSNGRARRELRPDRPAPAPYRAGGPADPNVDVVLELGRRVLLPDDGYEDWIAAPRERLLSRWQTVALIAARQAQAAGDGAKAHEIVEQMLEHDPADEAAHRLAIELYAAAGRHHAVRRQFALCQQALRAGLDAEPSAETVETFRAAEQASAADRSEHAQVARLVGRHAELERIEPLLDRVTEGHLSALVVRGPAGIGKTRLLSEVEAYARAADWQVVEWQAVESTRTLAYAPLRLGLGGLVTAAWVESLGEPARSGLATILPGLDSVATIPFADRSALVTAIVAGVGRIAAERPLCLAIDDLPLLDPSTFEVLAAVLAGLDAPILIATTLRDDEAVPDVVVEFVDQVGRSGGTELRLGPLAQRDLETLLLAHLGGDAVQRNLARFAFDLSEGNPLFCLEVVRSAHEQGAVRLEAGQWTLDERESLPHLPATVRRLVDRRSASLPAASQELLGVAAELGSEIGYRTLAAALPDIEGGVIPALDAALASGLLVERGSGYAFAHPLYRLAVGGSMGPARRAPVQLRIAVALAGVPVDPAASPEELAAKAASCQDPTSVAEHALSAVELGAVEAQALAIAFGFAGGARERRLFNHEIALDLLERSLRAWRRLPAGLARRHDAASALIHLAAICGALRREAEAEAALREATMVARTPRELMQAYCSRWELPYRHGDFEAALAVIEEGLARLPPEAIVERASLRRDYGWQLIRLRRLREAVGPTEEAIQILEQSEDRSGAARAVDQLAMILSYLGQRDRWVELEERALALALQGPDSYAELIGRLHLGVALTRTGFAARARPVYQRARELAQLMGHGYPEALEAWGSAEMEDELGNYHLAAEHRLRELRLLASFGGNPHNEAMSHAHLARLHRLMGDQFAAANETAAARQLAAQSGEAGYVDRIEQAITADRWSEVAT